MKKIIEECGHLCGAIYGKNKYGFSPLDLDGSEYKTRVRAKFKVFKLFTVKVEGFMLLRQKRLYVVFQGAFDLPDWISNFLFLFAKPVKPKNLDGKIRIHSGFLKQYIAISKQLRNNYKQIVQTYGNPEEIVVTGHSLGGALANICALDIKRLMKTKPVHLITFGSPKVGDKAFVNQLNNLVSCNYRFYNKNEYIPLLVPFPIYKHAGTEVHLNGPRRFPWLNAWDHGMNRTFESLKKYLVG